MEPFELTWKRVYWRRRQRAFQIRPGEPLGLTLQDAAAEFRVNVKTVSRAIRQLKAEGILLTQRKRGTLVHPQRPIQSKDGKIILHIVRHYETRATFGMLDEMSEHIGKAAERKDCRVIAVAP